MGELFTGVADGAGRGGESEGHLLSFAGVTVNLMTIDFGFGPGLPGMMEMMRCRWYD